MNNMNKTEIVSASEYNQNEVLLLVDVDYTTSFYEHLKKLGVNCQPPSGAIFRPRLFLDKEGRKLVEHEPLVNAIVATGTLKNFDGWINGWDIPI
jgi:hypothetical protein